MNEKEKNPWKIMSQKIVYDNKWITVREFNVINASGNKGIYGTVHFKNVAIGILVLDNDMNTYLVGQYRFPLKKYSWEIPEGGGKLNLDILKSAKRELLEETGIKANKWKKLLEMHLSNSVTDEKGIVFLAEDLEFYQSQPDEDEVLKIKKIHFNQAFQMVMNGEITDSLSVAAILKLKILLLEMNK